MKKFILLAIVTLILGCQNTVIPHQPILGEEFDIKMGQEIIFPEQNINLQFKAVPEDSRCPKGVSCVWAGNAKIAILFNKQEENLNTYTDPKKALIANYDIELISLSPYPTYKEEIPEKDYVAKLLITIH
jgi:hypothetical protein